MGIQQQPAARQELIDKHIESMREYAAELKGPLSRTSKIRARIEKCAREVERAHTAIKHREAMWSK